MATDQSTLKGASPDADGRGRTTFSSYVRDVAIVALVLGAALYLYYRHEQNRRKLQILGGEAKELMLKDSLKGYAGAEKRLLEMVALDSSQPFALASLAELYALRWLDLGIDADSANAHRYAALAEATDAKINERYGAGILVRVGDRRYEEALQYTAKIGAASSHGVNGYGRVVRGLGRLDEARPALQASADSEWRNPRFACDIADLYFESGDFANAQASYAKGIAANGDHLRSLIGHARAQIARGQSLKEAGEALAGVLGRPADQLTPKIKAMALTGMSELRGLEQKLDEGLKLADEAIALAPGSSWAHFAKARILAVQTDAQGAAAELDKALELDRYAPELYYTGSEALLDAGDATRAQAVLDAYAKALKEDDRFHIAYGNLLMKVGKPEEALQHFDSAIRLNGFSAEAHYAKGAALFDARQRLLADPRDAQKRAELMDGARKELELALEAREYFPAAHSKLGDLLFEKKEWVDGCQSYAQALVQMKALQVPQERLAELRDQIHGRLLTEARLPGTAKDWMDETGKLIR